MSGHSKIAATYLKYRQRLMRAVANIVDGLAQHPNIRIETKRCAVSHLAVIGPLGRPFFDVLITTGASCGGR